MFGTIKYTLKTANGKIGYTLACKGDMLPALLVWFHHNLAGFSDSNNNFCFFSKCHYHYDDGFYILLEID
jgi:hypothetical protein